MTGETESQPEERRDTRATGEGTEDREQQKLEDATLDPRAQVEQSGDIRQAEEVQENLTRLVENTVEVPKLEPPPIVSITEEEGTVKSRGDTISKDPAYLEVGGSRSGMSRIAKVEVPNLEPPPIVSIAEEEGTVKSRGDTISKDPAYLEVGGSRSGMGEIAKIDSFTDDPDKLTKTMTEEHQRENRETPEVDSPPLREE